MIKFLLYLVLLNGSSIEHSDRLMTEAECKSKGRQMTAEHVVVKTYHCHPRTVTAEEFVQ